MMDFLYITADKIGTRTGGGQVTGHECEALKLLGNVFAFDGGHMDLGDEPFIQDERMLEEVKAYYAEGHRPKLAHFYAGCFGKTVEFLQQQGCRVSYTVAAHDVNISRMEHRRLCGDFPYPHLNDPASFRRYIAGYVNADLVIAPGAAPMRVIKSQGRQGKIAVIPHGHDVPYADPIAPLPERFTVGYLGAAGPDKGVTYLIDAWGGLTWHDALLCVAGPGSDSPRLADYARNKGNVRFMGWVPDVCEFYDALSLYVQPSATEGFGIEVLEAMARGRPTLCSGNAGAADCLTPDWNFMARDVKDLRACLELARVRIRNAGVQIQRDMQTLALPYRWERDIYPKYLAAWRSIL